jgi:predicted small secreted protein
MIIYVFKKHEILLVSYKFLNFLQNIQGKWSEQEPEPHKKDRLRNTAYQLWIRIQIPASNKQTFYNVK